MISLSDSRSELVCLAWPGLVTRLRKRNRRVIRPQLCLSSILLRKYVLRARDIALALIASLCLRIWLHALSLTETRHFPVPRNESVCTCCWTQPANVSIIICALGVDTIISHGYPCITSTWPIRAARGQRLRKSQWAVRYNFHLAMIC